MLSMLLVVSSICFANTIKTLDKDTNLHPQGWTAGTLVFKGGTQATLNDQGEVITGVLKNYENLRPATDSFFSFTQWGTAHRPGCISFKGDTGATTFNTQGYVSSGTLGEDTEFSVYNHTEPYIYFKFCTNITFDQNGNIKSGTIKFDTFLRPVGWHNFLPADDNAGFIKFKSGTEVLFGPEGQVSSGSIAQDFSTVSGQTFKAGSMLQFDTTEPKLIN